MRKAAVEQPETDIDFLKMRDSWIDYINRNGALSHATVRVGTFVALRMNSRTKMSWWAVDNIAKEVSCSTKTVTVAIQMLEDEHLLVVTRRKRGGNTYSLRLPFNIT